MAPPIFNTLKRWTSLESLTIDFLCAWLLVPEMDPAMAPFLQNGVPLPKLRRIHLSQMNIGGLYALKFLKMPLLLEMYLSLEMDDSVDRLGEDGPPTFVTNRNSDFIDVGLLADLIRGDPEMGTPPRSLHIKAVSFTNGALFRVF
ncbi:hypothetical protein FA13DRAFT_58841 [Coprinellus micaceus]|uniref:F-box domain-containing protein n=1 Tax=Coprinellus micaceus TaxID=71717 RepID=A0A4Y7U2A4_COPMI|nr:hypothetical protein FA13DRAFT_58841 [Coprinellus micaceus]